MRHLRFACIFLLSFAFLAINAHAAAPETHVNHPALVKLHWQLGGSAAVFREMTTFEMMDLLHEMDFHHIELVPGQSLSPEKKDVKIGPEMSPEDVDALMARLKAVKLDIVSFGVANFGTNEADARKVFDFGKKVKLKVIVADAGPGSLEMLDKLANEYQISVALTCAGPARRYLTADVAAEAIKGRSNRIGVSADLAAWKAAGQDPVECIKKLNGHVIHAHLSDIDAQGKPTPVGTGTVNVDAALTELFNQQYKGICCVQDETPAPDQRLANFAKSVNAFSDVLTKLAGQ